MRLGLSTLFCLREPLPTAIKSLDKISVEHVEIVDEGLHALNSRRVGMLKKIVFERGINISVHAPFADINIASTSLTIRNAIMKRLKKSIELSAQLNSECWVFHPGMQSAVSNALQNLDWKINLKSTRELLKEAEKRGLKIAIENVPDPFPFLLKRAEEFERFYEDLGEDELNLGIAFDVGHANINREINEFIERFRSKIIHIHVHDNNGDSDTHLGVGFGSIDWVEVISVIKKINYRGVLVIESKENVEESIQTLKRLFK